MKTSEVTIVIKKLFRNKIIDGIKKLCYIKHIFLTVVTTKFGFLVAVFVNINISPGPVPSFLMSQKSNRSFQQCPLSGDKTFVIFILIVFIARTSVCII